MKGLFGKDNHFYGKHHSEETKRKLSVKRKEMYKNGYKHPLLGKKRPDMVGENNPAKRLEVRKKIGEARKVSKNNM